MALVTNCSNRLRSRSLACCSAATRCSTQSMRGFFCQAYCPHHCGLILSHHRLHQKVVRNPDRALKPITNCAAISSAAHSSIRSIISAAICAAISSAVIHPTLLEPHHSQHLHLLPPHHHQPLKRRNRRNRNRSKEAWRSREHACKPAAVGKCNGLHMKFWGEQHCDEHLRVSLAFSSASACAAQPTSGRHRAEWPHLIFLALNHIPSPLKTIASMP